MLRVLLGKASFSEKDGTRLDFVFVGGVSMKFSLMARYFFACAFFFFGFSPAARAELEYYGFPSPSKAEARPSVKPADPVLVKKNAQAVALRAKELEKRRQAQRKSISNLLSRYNRKLSKRMALDYAEYILQASEKFQQDPFVVAAMIVNESSARHDAVSKGGDYGLMQVRWRVHRRSITKKYPHIRDAKDILDPEYNVLIGTEILARYHASAEDLKGGLLRYSAGNRKLADRIFAVLRGLQDSYHEHLRTL